jgi:hypothetical protein
MRSSIFVLFAFLARPRAQRVSTRWALALMLGTVLGAPVLRAQQASDGADSDKQTIQMLVRRVEQLEARVAQLEAIKSPAPAGAASQAPAPSPAPAAAPAETPAAGPVEAESEAKSAHTMAERMDTSSTLLRIRGFGDVNLHGGDQRGTTTSFTLGQLDLFVTSDVSEKFKFLSEIVFEADPANTFGVDIERLLLQYSPNDYFNLSAGRFHTAIGYYNTAYHHSTWLQTATGRPFLFNFEDNGGPLPIHNVGISATGLIPSGRLGLHYVAEVGNGRASSSPLAEAVQSVVDENNGKAVNFALFVQPEAVRGLQAGFSAYHDHLTPIGSPGIGELIFDAYGVLIRPNFEWLNEALLIRHAIDHSSRVFNTPGFYTQLSRRWGAYRPYFRYQFVNEADAEPVFPAVGRRQGPSVGLRFDASESVALKLQYDRTDVRHQPGYNTLGLQLGFTF